MKFYFLMYKNLLLSPNVSFDMPECRKKRHTVLFVVVDNAGVYHLSVSVSDSVSVSLSLYLSLSLSVCLSLSLSLILSTALKFDQVYVHCTSDICTCFLLNSLTIHIIHVNVYHVARR